MEVQLLLILIFINAILSIYLGLPNPNPAQGNLKKNILVKKNIIGSEKGFLLFFFLSLSLSHTHTQHKTRLRSKAVAFTRTLTNHKIL